MLLSIIINTYERPEKLGRCVETISRQKNADPYEVIIVDDGGRLDLKAILRLWESRMDIRMIRIEHSGRAESRNRGVDSAGGQRILFLGDDIRGQPGCLAAHRSVSDPNLAVVGPYPMTDLQGTDIFKRWAEPNPQDHIEDSKDAGWKYFATGNLSMSRERFLHLGGFDNRYRCYGWEDLDLGLNFERTGGKLVFDPKARARHEHGGITRRQLWQRERELGFTAWQFWEKWSVTAGDEIRWMKFWGNPEKLKAGPAWRTAMGHHLVGLADRLAPKSSLASHLYERMIYSCRLSGVAEAYRQSRHKPGEIVPDRTA
jgi:glycosyltransferase involved in cell wall biosynthesis